MFLFLCASALWTLRKTRNDLVFNDKIVPEPMVVAHRMLARWKPLLALARRRHPAPPRQQAGGAGRAWRRREEREDSAAEGARAK